MGTIGNQTAGPGRAVWMGRRERGTVVRARVIERASGAVVGEIEAETSYALWQALLTWGEQQGLPRFRVPERYRTERMPEAEAASEGAAGTAAPAMPPPVEAPNGRRGAPRPAAARR